MKTLRHPVSAIRLLQAAPHHLANRIRFSLAGRFRQTGRNRQGFGTLEVVIIIAVILSIALLFRKTLSAYATNLINSVFAGDPLAN